MRLRLSCGIVILAVVAFAAVVVHGESYIPNAKHPELPGNCLHRDLKAAIPVGDTYRPIRRKGYCNEFYCREDYIIRVSHCSRYQVGEGCKVVPTDYSKPYPDCCAHPVCPNENEIQ